MNGHADIAVIGAGHNSLVAATLLAKSGKRVVVLEQGDRIGGTACTDEIAPGFRVSGLFATADRLHPDVVSELRLTSHGLRFERAGGTLLLRPGEAPLHLPEGGAAAAIDTLSSRDGAAYREFERLLGAIGRAIEPILSQPLPPIETSGIGSILDLLMMGWRLRRLGKRDMPEALRLLPMALRDVTEERFENERLRAAIASSGLQASWLGPWSPGGAFGLLYHRPAWRAGLFDSPTHVHGGLGALAEALGKAATTAGVEIRTGARVQRIRVADEGVAGVMLESGKELPAHQVLSGVDPRTTLLELLEPGWLEPDIVSAVDNIRMRGTVSVVRLALATLPAFGASDEASLAGRIQIGPTLEYLERAFDPAKYGELPAHPSLEITIPSLTDESLAPAGKHVMHVWVQYTPFALREGTWESERQRLGDTVVSTIEEYAPGFSATIEQVDVLTPADIQARWSITGGHPYHGEMAMDQVLYLRPVPGWYDYRTPVAGLYLCGPGCHPGGGITGLPGRNAARRALMDWKS